MCSFIFFQLNLKFITILHVETTIKLIRVTYKSHQRVTRICNATLTTISDDEWLDWANLACLADKIQQYRETLCYRARSFNFCGSWYYLFMHAPFLFIDNIRHKTRQNQIVRRHEI